MTIIGYARTSTADQVAGLADQVAVLEAAGCQRIFKEHVSALATKRPELDACLASIGDGDTFVVTKPDRLARSVPTMLAIIDDLKRRDVTVRILSMGLDTSTTTGKLIVTIMAAIADWERQMMLERQRAGIAKAKAEGKYKGRRAILSAGQIDAAKVRLAEGSISKAALARELGIGRMTLWRALG